MYKLHLIDFLFFKKSIGVYLIYNVALVSGIAKWISYTYNHS